jgi:hypothetical protein
MPIIDADDIQVHLPVDKFNVNDVPDSVEEVSLDTERIVKGTLSTVFEPATLAAWATPETTPEMIRAIGGRLAAGLLYALRLAEDWPDLAEYAQNKYNDGLSYLNMVRDGVITLPEVDEDPAGAAHLTAENFTVGEPVFFMGDEF